MGEIFPSRNFGNFQVIGIGGKNTYRIRFIATGYETDVRICKIKDGKIKDKLVPNVYGVGYIGSGEYSCKTHRKIYDRWKKMLARCYSGNFPHYEGCTVCERWFNFQNFVNDCFTLPGYSPDLTGLDLDKDTRLEGANNKIYSPSTCCFIPHGVNFNNAMRYRRGNKNNGSISKLTER